EAGLCKSETYANSIWKVLNIKNILKHKVYIGHMVQGVKRQSFHDGRKQYYRPESEWDIVENTHEPIIDEETFTTVQNMAKAAHNAYYENLGKFDDLGKTENILQGLVYCADCGRPLVRYKSVSHGKKMWYTFICPLHSTDKNACPLKSIREDELLSVLQEAITKQIALAVDMQALTATVNSSPAHKMQSVSKQSLLEQERKALKRCEELRDSLYQNYVEKLMTEREYMTMKERYTSETEARADRIKELEQQIEAAKVYTPENRFLASFSFFKGASTLSRDLLVALIDRIEVGEGNRVNIKFRFQDEFLILNDYLRKEATPDEYGSKVSPHIQ
ncbi:MAG: recombinase family protein, partial [Oscillospiraceae bacterium]|nr:recombinase family protein [Oscillospiraceae bacterium]